MRETLYQKYLSSNNLCRVYSVTACNKIEILLHKGVDKKVMYIT